MTIEDYLSKECNVNPDEKISTNDDSWWKLKDLVAGYIEEEELVENLTIPRIINSRLSELEEENRLLKLIIENGLGAEDLENDCL